MIKRDDMKIDFNNYDFSEFIIKEGLFCNISAKLIIPNFIGTKFTQKNKIFRSSIWDLNGNLLSASFPKFENYNVNLENFPPPKSLEDSSQVMKIDGSTYVVDYVNDTISVRTRGCFSYKDQSNFCDFEYCLEKYPLIKDYVKSNSNFTLVFEIVTPNQQIVINYGSEPDLYLIGRVNKLDYSLTKQSELDKISDIIKVKRPIYYNFNNLEELIDNITKAQNVEGLCLYSNNDQDIHRIKTNWYLLLHRMKDSLSSIDKVIDLWAELEYPDYTTFYNYLLNQFDINLVLQVQGYISKICKAGIETKKVLDFLCNFVQTLSGKSRKEQALAIQEKFGKSSVETTIAFILLNNKEITSKMMKELVYKQLNS